MQRALPAQFVGMSFGDLTVERKAPPEARFWGQRAWVCRCACGNVVTVTTSSLKKGTRSCGCAIKAVLQERNTTHGHAGSATYSSWHEAKRRSTATNREYSAHYVERGITMCDRWRNSFEAFLADMGERPSGTSLDRIENDKGYEPGNCRWATRAEQARNRTDNRLLTFGGRTQTTADWEKELGFPGSVLRKRLYRGWSVEEALGTPRLR
jgi:hypothetical protein